MEAEDEEIVIKLARSLGKASLEGESKMKGKVILKLKDIADTLEAENMKSALTVRFCIEKIEEI
jgi:ribosomal 30S subunit maturation factor RimM